jgi:hypothetical protein
LQEVKKENNSTSALSVCLLRTYLQEVKRKQQYFCTFCLLIKDIFAGSKKKTTVLLHFLSAY